MCEWKSWPFVCHPLHNRLTLRTLTSRAETAGINTCLPQRSSAIWDDGQSVTGLGSEGGVTSQSFKTSLPPPAPAAARCLSHLLSRKPKRPPVRWKILRPSLDVGYQVEFLAQRHQLFRVLKVCPLHNNRKCLHSQSRASLVHKAANREPKGGIKTSDRLSMCHQNKVETKLY